jgi:hypothetical protein
LHDDAVRYAYSFNAFELRDDFTAFCRLGALALSSIRSLTVVQGAWRAETPIEDSAWSLIGSRCLNLQRLEVILLAEMLIPAIPYLAELSETSGTEEKSAKIAVDLHVWDRHFVFDADNRDYTRAQQMINGTHVSGPHTPRFIPPRERILRLPVAAHQIILTTDVTSGTLRAVDDYLSLCENPFLIKTTRDLPEKGYRAAGGRSNRYWYDLQR